MPKVTYSQTSFNSGELSPRFFGRTDNDKYKSGLATCENAIVLPQGGVMRRPGFEFIHAVKDSSKAVELIPFEFSETQAYVLEFGDSYMRVYTDGGIVVNPDSYTVLLVHCDGDDGDFIFTDESDSAHTVTTNGNSQVDTAYYAFATGSLLLDGVGDSISVADHADFNFGDSDGAIDLWVRFATDGAVGISTLYYQGDTTVGDLIWLYVDHSASKLHVLVVDGGVELVNLASAWSPTHSVWYHVALTWDDTAGTKTFRWFVDGTLKGNSDFTITMPDHDGTVYFGGWSSQKVTDMSLGGRAVSITNAVLSTTYTKFSGASIYFDGTGDYLSLSNDADFDILSLTDFTIDLWIKLADIAAPTGVLLLHYEDANNYWMLWSFGGAISWKVYSGGGDIVTLTSAADALNDTDWHHIALVKISNVYAIYADGAQDGYVSDADTDTFNGNMYIGSFAGLSLDIKAYMQHIRISNNNRFSATPDVSGTGDTIVVPTLTPVQDANTIMLLRGDFFQLKGWMDEIRVSKGAYRWSANFTRPSQEYPAAGGYVEYELVTPYSTTDLASIRTVQSADTMYIAHPSYNVRKLTRTAHDNWAITEIDWNQPAWCDINATAITLDSAATTGTGIALVASAPYFATNMVGAYFYMHNGFGRIASVSDSTNATWDIKSNLDAHTATADWYRGRWDGDQGYPSCIVFHEDRLVLSGVSSHPLSVFFSKVGDYEDFSQSSPVVDDDGLTVTIWSQQQNTVRWMMSGKRLFVGSAGAEFWISGATADTPITPTSMQAKPETRIGSESVQPLMLDNAVIFVQDGGERLRLWSYLLQTDGWESLDLNLIAEHLTTGNDIHKIQYQQFPNSVLWATTHDGTLLGLTVIKDQKVVAWHKHTTGTADIETIAVIPGATEDELWAVVVRTVNSATVRYVERLHTEFHGDAIADSFFVDSGLSYSGLATTNFTGMDHLEGETVAVLADGVYIGTKTISSGAFTLDTAATNVHAGLAYNTNLVTLPWDLDSKGGSTDTMKKRIVNLLFKVYETSELQFGRDSSNLMDIPMTDGTLYTQWFVREHNGDTQRDPTVYIRQNKPLPATLLSLAADIELGGK